MSKATNLGGKTAGAVLRANLARLGYADVVIRVGEVSEKVGLTKQRISAILNAENVLPETVEKLAKGLKVKPSELTRPPAPPKPRRKR